jgi:energy-coupling factor transporter ATP-binding protein EcfA2
MPVIRLTLRNYRAFTNKHPAEFAIQPGFTGFIGKNNAGKSTCLRALFELRRSFQDLRVDWLCQRTAVVTSAILGEQDATVVLNFDNDEPGFVSVDIDPPDMDGVLRLAKVTMRLSRDGHMQLEAVELSAKPNESRLILRPPFSGGTAIKGPNFGEIAAQMADGSGMVRQFSCLDFAAALNTLCKVAYYGPYRNAINEGAGQYFDLAVGTAVVAQWDSWKAGSQLAPKRAIAKVERDIARLLGAQTVEINATSDNRNLDVKVDKHPFKLSDLGAGVSELVITFANALVNKPDYIFIDEPESHLHPSLQLDFLTTLAEYSRQGVYLSTHSIGLARSICDTLFVVSREQDSAVCIPYEAHPRLSELLGNLSYSNFYPLNHAYVLLVEGTTEVRTFQVLLRKLNKDHHFVLLPMGGSQLIREGSDLELSEVIRIAGAAERVFAIIDSERGAAQEVLTSHRSSFAQSCSALNIRLHITERRATENYFTRAAVQAALGPSFQELGPFDDVRNSSNGWAKSQNWRIAEREADSFFADNDLGRFLAELPKT